VLCVLRLCALCGAGLCGRSRTVARVLAQLVGRRRMLRGSDQSVLRSATRFRAAAPAHTRAGSSRFGRSQALTNRLVSPVSSESLWFVRRGYCRSA
jgi:hypothetical protein